MSAVQRLTLIFLCALLPAFASAGPKVESWSTPGGAKVMYVHASDLPMVDVRVVFDAGSARDGDKPGVATLTNALLAEGAGPWSADEIAQRIEDVGAELKNESLRDMGYVSVRSLTDPEVLGLVLETLEKVLAEPRFDAPDLERQRQQMLIALRKEQEDPGDIVSRQFYASLYRDHPYAHDPLGDAAAVSALTREDVLAFHRKFYVARNAVIAIVGDVDRPAAERIAKQLMSGLPEGEHAPALPAAPEAIAETLNLPFDATQTHVRIGAPGMARQDPDYFALYVGNHVLGGNGLVSILSQEVREKRGLSYSIYSYFLPMRAQGPFIMGAQTRSDRAGETLEVMRETLRSFIEKGPGEEELASAKRNITGGFPLRVASNSKIVDYLAMMGFYDYPLDYLDTFVSRVEAVTAEDVRDAFRRRLDAKRLFVVTVGNGA